jgi:ribosomal protein L7Ae-like RNA K-turn-binding protein
MDLIVMISSISYLGLCNKAGGLVSGEAACEKAIKTGNARLVIISEDASSGTIR